MARACSICTSGNQEAIDRDLLGPEPVLRIAARWRVAESSLRRHRDNHLSPRVANKIAKREDVNAERLVSWLVGINERCIAGFVRTQEEGDHAAARWYVHEFRRNLELVARLGGLLVDGPQVLIDQRQQQATFQAFSEEDLRLMLEQARREAAELEARSDDSSEQDVLEAEVVEVAA